MLASAVRSFDVEQVRNITVISLTIDSLNEQNFEAVAEDLDGLLLTRKPRRVVVDLVRLKQIDDLGLAILQSFHDGIESPSAASLRSAATKVNKEHRTLRIGASTIV